MNLFLYSIGFQDRLVDGVPSFILPIDAEIPNTFIQAKELVDEESKTIFNISEKSGSSAQ